MWSMLVRRVREAMAFLGFCLLGCVALIVSEHSHP